MLRILSSAMMGLVCVLGGAVLSSRMIFLCTTLSGWMYFFLVSDVPQMEMLLMRWGYACVKYRSLSVHVGRSLFAYLSLCMKGQSLRMMLLMVWSCLSVFWTVRPRRGACVYLETRVLSMTGVSV